MDRDGHGGENAPMRPGPVLVVAETVAADVHRELARAGRAPKQVPDMVTALRELRRYHFEEVLLDSENSRVDALELVVAIRDTGSRVPILILPAPGEESVHRALDGEPSVLWLDTAPRDASLRGALERRSEPQDRREDETTA